MGFFSRQILTRTLLIASLLLSGCAAIKAQNPDAGYAPVNAIQLGSEERVMLKGFDVVSYFVDQKSAIGTPQYKSTYKNVVFYFATAEHKNLFDKTPEKYLPEFGGYCADGITYAIPWGGDGDTWKMIDGRVYIFGGQGSKDAFLLDEKTNLSNAQRYWNAEVNGSNSFWQRVKRLLFHVPNYKTGAELAKAVSEAKAQGRL
jgi:YHS domain-containing protein